jgi:hypothetical protein
MIDCQWLTHHTRACRLWVKQTEAFAKTHRCVAVSMPLYDEDAKAFPTYSQFGYNFDATTASLAAAIKFVDPPSLRLPPFPTPHSMLVVLYLPTPSSATGRTHALRTWPGRYGVC